jgi:hypothetical protein
LRSSAAINGAAVSGEAARGEEDSIEFLRFYLYLRFYLQMAERSKTFHRIEFIFVNLKSTEEPFERRGNTEEMRAVW